MYRLFQLIALLSIVLLLQSCWAIQKGDKFEHLAPGAWRGLFVFGEKEAAEKIPVIFIVKNTDNDQPIEFEFLNGEQSLKPDSIRFWGDTLFVYFFKQKSYLRLIFELDIMEGFLYDEDNKEYPIEFYAQNSSKSRFLDLRQPPIHDLNGIWALDVLNEEEDIIPARLDLKVEKNKVLASLKMDKDSVSLSLEGTIQHDKLMLSAFTGNKVYLLKADVRDINTLGRGTLRINEREWACGGKRVKG